MRISSIGVLLKIVVMISSLILLKWALVSVVPPDLKSVQLNEVHQRVPSEELLTESLNLIPNQINLVHRLFPNINGKGIHMAITEQQFDPSDIDLRGRTRPSGREAADISTHAGIMATIMAGGGNTSPGSKGVAWQANLFSLDFAPLMPEEFAFYRTNAISIQNHSYGVDIENFYGEDAAAYDRTTFAYPPLLHVFSAGNRGEEAAELGSFTGIPGFANLTGSFKHGKNSLIVGATDAYHQVSNRSSRGPAHDGRIKPELVAFGADGSSGGAALVSGTAALIQQYYHETMSSLPSASLTKCLLIAGADDIQTAGPDFTGGFGRLNASQSLDILETGHFSENSIDHDEINTTNVMVPSGMESINFTLVWSDPPAMPQAAQALVHDLDLLIITPQGDTILPWILSSATHVDSLAKPAKRGVDSLNNVEQISWQNPVIGSYQMQVRGKKIRSEGQTYAVAWSMTTSNSHWCFPLKNDALIAKDEVPLHWQINDISGQKQALYFSYDSIDWKILTDEIGVDQLHFLWTTPDTTALGYLRLSNGFRDVVTGPFLIAPRPNLEVLFVCEDSVALGWELSHSEADYTLFALGENYMERVAGSENGEFIFSTEDQISTHWALGIQYPFFDQTIRSFTIDYTLQAASCRITSLTASLNAQGALLELELGSERNVEGILFERIQQGKVTEIANLTPTGKLTYEVETHDLEQGINLFRVAITLAKGEFIFSDPVELFYPGVNSYLVFPNPVPQGSFLRLIGKGEKSDRFLLINAQGQLVYQRSTIGADSEFLLEDIPPGIYFYRMLGSTEKRWQKLMIE